MRKKGINPKEKRIRNFAIVYLRGLGFSLQEIKDSLNLNISRERIRNIEEIYKNKHNGGRRKENI